MKCHINAALLILLLLSFSNGFSQTILLDKIVEDSISIPSNGPNSKKYTHFYISIGNYISSNQNGIKIDNIGSLEYEFGIRHKKKLNETFSFGFGSSISSHSFKIKQDSAKSFPLPDLFEKELIRINSVNLQLFQRINYGKRGNYMGIFTDIGVKGSWNFHNKNITTTNSGNFMAKKIVTEYFQPTYIKAFSYSLFIRAGVNNVVFYFNLPLSETIDQNKYSQDLNGFWCGLQFGLHK